MGFKYGFQDGIKYGVEDINNIVANFTTAGVNIFTNIDENNLNTLSQALTEAGVEGSASNSCKVKFDKDTSKLKILPGVAFFDDGSTITIDSSGVLLEPHRYVYLKKDLITNTGYPVSSDEAPGEHDIPLAEYQNGDLTDRRHAAVSKIPGFGQQTCGLYHPKFTLSPTDGSWKTFFTFEDIDPNWNFVMVFDDAEDLSDKCFIGWGNMKTGNYWSACLKEKNSNYAVFDYGGEQMTIHNFYGSSIKQIRFINTGIKIEIQCKTSGINTESALHLHVEFA